MVDTDLLTVAEVAKLLKCESDKVRTLIASGRLQAINIGTASRKFYRVEYSAVQRFKAHSLVVPETEPVKQSPKPKLVTSQTRLAWRKANG